MKYNVIIKLLPLALLCSSVARAEDAIQADPTATPASIQISSGFAGNYLSGQFAKSNGDIKGAIRYLRSAYKNAPGDPGVAAQLEGLLLLDGKVDEAILIAEDINQHGSDPVSILLATVKQVKKGDLEKASEVLSPAFETDSGQLWLPLVSGWIEAGQGRIAKPLALEDLNINSNKTSQIVSYHLALINAQAGFTDAAAVNFKNAVEDTKIPAGRIMSALVQFYDRNGSPPLLKSIAETYRPLTEAPEVRGSSPSISTPREGIAEVLYTMGSVMQSAGITQDAVIYLQLSLYLHPSLSIAALTMGDAYSELRQYEKANASYAKIEAGNYLYTKAQLRRAVNYNQLGRFPEALEMLERLAKTSAGVPEVLIAQGDLLRLHARYGEAVKAYSQALQHIPKLQEYHWPVLFARGVSFEHTGKWELAEQDMQHALRLTPDQPDVLNYLGYSWLVRGEHTDKARDMIARAVKARPNDAQIVDSMGWGLYLAGQYDEATEYLEKAVDLMPNDPVVNDHLGDVYWRLGRKTEARYQWERALSFSPETSLVGIIQKKLKDGLPEITQAQDILRTNHAMSGDPVKAMAVTE